MQLVHRLKTENTDIITQRPLQKKTTHTHQSPSSPKKQSTASSDVQTNIYKLTLEAAWVNIYNQPQ